MDEPQLFHSVSPDILPPSASSVQLAGHKSAPKNVEIGHVYNFTGHSPAFSVPPMKENIPPTFPLSEPFEPPSYDSFFSTFRGSLDSPPTSYDSLWNTPLFQSTSSTTLSPIESSPSLGTLSSFSSSGELSTPSVSTTPSYRHSSATVLRRGHSLFVFQ
jgi:hypothetical protein